MERDDGFMMDFEFNMILFLSVEEHNFGNHLTRSSNFKGFPNAFASSKITENPRVLLCQLVSQVHVLAMATASTGTEHMLIGPRNTGSECIVKICED